MRELGWLGCPLDTLCVIMFNEDEGGIFTVETEADKQEFIGKIVYIGHDSKQARGWFSGRVQSRDLSAADLKKTPSANFIIKYQSKETNKKLNGSV